MEKGVLSLHFIGLRIVEQVWESGGKRGFFPLTLSDYVEIMEQVWKSGGKRVSLPSYSRTTLRSWNRCGRMVEKGIFPLT